MSTIIHPRQNASSRCPSAPTTSGGKKWLWSGLIMGGLFGLVVVMINVFRAQEPEAAAGATMTPTVIAVPAPEIQAAPVADVAAPAASHNGNAPAAPERELASPPPISFEQREHMQREMRQNEALPPEERRPLAPTPAMMRALDEERGVPQ